MNCTLMCMLLAKRKHGVNFSETAMIGRQGLMIEPKSLKKTLSLVQPVDEATLMRIQSCDGYSEELFRHLGASRVDSFDISDYEGASVIHDMGEPIPDQYAEKYSVVFDGGTLEHVYKCTVALDNEMRMVAPGGHLISCVPTSQYSGHGFYQFSPELFYSILDRRNGFVVQDMFILEGSRKVSSVKSPIEVQERVSFTTRSAADLFVIAQKVGPMPSEISVYQSDYIATWSGKQPNGRLKMPFIPLSIKKLVPISVKNAIKYLVYPHMTKRVNITRELKQLSGRS